MNEVDSMITDVLERTYIVDSYQPRQPTRINVGYDASGYSEYVPGLEEPSRLSLIEAQNPSAGALRYRLVPVVER